MQIVTRRYDHPDARKLEAEVQQEYARRYQSDGDSTPLDPEMFTPPHGVFFLAYDDEGRPVATGGWRGKLPAGEGYEEGDAEIKRMYVVPEARGRGLARRILARLEEDARAAGRLRMVLETGTEQPEAIELYTSSGYSPAPSKFGLYRHEPKSRCFVKSLTEQG
ncbi:GNAT family N-acetyltransferase [Streptomyces durbertensis]|uniref:GNAT family N-acetyltransferase n=1 Tax=Streptomyces durbertensis TaxID=2448886 RepID=A0ABR6EEY7_9ACTN|nr:GNAT family N-acetyltransferase [Streptomyces durbertensis]MBB1243905.1 GNAT family N-acetyltransferase [Streptomyces durbertensis]